MVKFDKQIGVWIVFSEVDNEVGAFVPHIIYPHTHETEAKHTKDSFRRSQLRFWFFGSPFPCGIQCENVLYELGEQYNCLLDRNHEFEHRSVYRSWRF